MERTQALGFFGADAPPVPPEPEGKGQGMRRATSQRTMTFGLAIGRY